MTRRELMARMGNDELMEQLAFDRIHPLPDPHWSAALIASTVARAMGSKGARLEHFLPEKKQPQAKPGAKVRVGPGVLERVRKAKGARDRVAD